MFILQIKEFLSFKKSALTLPREFPTMTTPILFGSPRAQKGYITPNSQGVTGRSTNLGYRTPVRVGRYQLPPPVPPPIATGYNYGFLVGNRAPTTPGNFADTAIEQYNFSNDTVNAQTITLPTEGTPAPLIPTVEPFLSGAVLSPTVTSSNGNANQHGSNSYGFKSNRSSPFNGNKDLYAIGQVFYWNYANTAEQSNNVDLAPGNFLDQSSINDKTNDRGLVQLGYQAGPGAGTDRIYHFPFNTGTFVGNLQDISDGFSTFPVATPLDPTFDGYKSLAVSAQDLNNGFSVGGRDNPAVFPVQVGLKVPFANLTTSKFIGGLDTLTSAGAGNSSITHGYTSAGYSYPPPNTIVTTIFKYPFAADVSLDQTVAGDLDTGVIYAGSFSSDTNAHVATGRISPSPIVDITQSVQKFSFANDTPVTNTTTLAYSTNQSDGSSEG